MEVQAASDDASRQRVATPSRPPPRLRRSGTRCDECPAACRAERHGDHRGTADILAPTGRGLRAGGGRPIGQGCRTGRLGGCSPEGRVGGAVQRLADDHARAGSHPDDRDLPAPTTAPVRCRPPARRPGTYSMRADGCTGPPSARHRARVARISSGVGFWRPGDWLHTTRHSLQQAMFPMRSYPRCTPRGEDRIAKGVEALRRRPVLRLGSRPRSVRRRRLPVGQPAAHPHIRRRPQGRHPGAHHNRDGRDHRLRPAMPPAAAPSAAWVGR